MMRVRIVPLTNAQLAFRKRFTKTHLTVRDLGFDDTHFSLPMVRGDNLEMRFVNLLLDGEHPLCPPNQYLCLIERGIMVFPNLRNFSLTYQWKKPSDQTWHSQLFTLSYQHPTRYANPLALVHDPGNRGTHFSQSHRYVTMDFDITSDPPYALFQSRFLNRKWHSPNCPARYER